MTSAAKIPKILVIMGSIRENRNCKVISDWILEVARQTGHKLEFELVDLQTWELPNDELNLPSQHKYESEYTKKWSEYVDSANGFLMVSPQYNWGYPAALKNALDHLYQEWHNKPVLLVTYGGHGGSKCNAQLREVFQGLKMKNMQTSPQISISREQILNGVKELDPSFTEYKPVVEKAINELADSFEPLSGTN